MALVILQAQLLTQHLSVLATTATPEQRQFLEGLMRCARDLDQAAVAGGQLAALAQALTATTTTRAPKLVHEPRAQGRRGRHLFFSTEGCALQPVLEADRKAAGAAAKWGFRNGQHETA